LLYINESDGGQDLWWALTRLYFSTPEPLRMISFCDWGLRFQAIQMCGAPTRKLAASTLFYIKSGKWGIDGHRLCLVEQLDVDVCLRIKEETTSTHWTHTMFKEIRQVLRWLKTVPDLKDLTVQWGKIDKEVHKKALS